MNIEEILISTKEQGIDLYKQFDSFSCKQDIHRIWNISDNSAGCKLVSELANRVGFDLAVYKKRKKKYCLNCNKLLSKSQKKFCSKSCSATYNNVHRGTEIYQKIANTLAAKWVTKSNIQDKKATKLKASKKKLPSNEIKKSLDVNVCKNCGKPISKSNIYCSSRCYSEFVHKTNYKNYLVHPEQYNRGNYTPRSFYSEFLNEQNNKCAICGCNPTHNGKDLRFVIDHIDGDASNNKRSNIRLICPNCDSQTDTFKSKNKNSTRQNYYREKILKQSK